MKRQVTKEFRIYDRVFQVGEVFSFDESRGKIEIGDRILYIDFNDIGKVVEGSDRIGCFGR